MCRDQHKALALLQIGGRHTECACYKHDFRPSSLFHKIFPQASQEFSILHGLATEAGWNPLPSENEN
jgi:hypothetical protein